MRAVNLRAYMSEAELQSQTIQLARLKGWRLTHFRPAQDRTGRWKTPLQGDVGFPDFIALRAGCCVVLEFKSEKGKPGPGQEVWIAAFAAVAGIEALIVRPHDWPLIEALLT